MTKTIISIFSFLLSIIPIFSCQDLTLFDIQKFERIQCKSNKDCPNNLNCKNNVCQYPNYYCFGTDKCVEENITNNIYYYHEKDLEHNRIPYDSKTLIIEACYNYNPKCKTRTCFRDNDCFTNKCDMASKRCIIRDDTYYGCINDPQNGGMICGKYLEQKCINDDECLSDYECDRNYFICKEKGEDILSFLSNALTPNLNKNNEKNIEINKIVDEKFNIKKEDEKFNIKKEDEKFNIKKEEEKNKTVKSSTLLKKIIIIFFIISPIVIFTQYIKSTKLFKNIKQNKKEFKYKSVVVDINNDVV